MNQKWSKEKANEWYKKQGWLRGCNFIGSDCTNRLDMWQSYKSEEKLVTADKELALCDKIGFNTVRLWMNFDVYYKEKNSYMDILEKYISLCDKHHQKVMIVLAYEEDLPRGEVFVAKEMGEQKYALGEHQGRIPLEKEEIEKTPYHYLEYKELHDIFIEMVKNIVSKYANDERVLCWNIFNEPGIMIGERNIPLLKELFEVVRSYNPIQPLCADIWRGLNEGKIKSAEEQLAYDLSDVISFHSYLPYSLLVEELHYHLKDGRPVLLTEWLHRINHNNIFEIYPLLYLNNVANYCWGFVVGKTQTHEPWPHMWDEYYNGIITDFDFTKWQHDLFRPNLRPYDPREIKVLEKYNNLAKKEGR